MKYIYITQEYRNMHVTTFTLSFIITFLATFISYNIAFRPPPSDFFQDIDGISIAPGQLHTCVIEQKHGIDVGGQLLCWGKLTNGLENYPREDIFVQVISGSDFSCGIRIDQSVTCWGNIHWSAYGLFSQITAASHHACGILTSGRLRCWGYREYDPPESYRKDIFVQISCTTYHCCAINHNGHIRCFGTGGHQGEMNPPLLPNITSITYSDNMGNEEEEMEEEAGIESLEQLEDQYDELEVDHQNILKSEQEEFLEDEEEPEEENEFELEHHQQFKQVSVGDSLSCGILLDDAHVLCWGNQAHHTDIPTIISGPVRQVSVNKLGVCVIYDHVEKYTGNNEAYYNDLLTTRSEGSLECWGIAATMIPKHHMSSADISIDGKISSAVSSSTPQQQQQQQQSSSSSIQQWKQIRVGLGGLICGVDNNTLLTCWSRYGKKYLYNERSVYVAA